MIKMKFPAILLLVALATVTTSAQDRSDVFDENTKITWLGLDFTQAKFIGDREHWGSESDMRRFVLAWNELILKEASKYNIAAAIGKKSVENATDVTKDNNEQLDVLAMYSDSERDYVHLNQQGVSEIISNYDFKGLTGVGLMFNIESFSKLNDGGSMWITFINMGSRKVLFTEHLTAPPKGIGMRNYWAGSIFGILEKMKKKEFEMWRNKYYSP